MEPWIGKRLLVTGFSTPNVAAIKSNGIVAFADTLPVGSVSLVECDLPSHQHLTPWLASLFVATPYQKQGIGSKLVQQIESIAVKIGYQQLYLFTWTAAYYSKLGWTAIATTTPQGLPESVVMQKTLKV